MNELDKAVVEPVGDSKLRTSMIRVSSPSGLLHDDKLVIDLREVAVASYKSGKLTLVMRGNSSQVATEMTMDDWLTVKKHLMDVILWRDAMPNA